MHIERVLGQGVETIVACCFYTPLSTHPTHSAFSSCSGKCKSCRRVGHHRLQVMRLVVQGRVYNMMQHLYSSVCSMHMLSAM